MTHYKKFCIREVGASEKLPMGGDSCFAYIKRYQKHNFLLAEILSETYDFI